MGCYDGNHIIKKTDDKGIQLEHDGWDCKGEKLTNVKDPSSNNDVVTLGYANKKYTIASEDYSTHLTMSLFSEEMLKFDMYYELPRINSLITSAIPTSPRVESLLDQSLSGSDASQSVNNLKPAICTKAERVNNRYFLKFTGTEFLYSEVNLNHQTVSMFIVYKLTSLQGNYWIRCGLTGNDRSWNKFIAFGPLGDLVVSGTSNQITVFGSNNVTNGHGVSGNPVASFLPKANPGALNVWNCLSVHWYENQPGNRSQVWCNGKRLGYFVANSSQGLTNTYVGHITNSQNWGLKGYIGFFGVKKSIMPEISIKLIHHALCQNFAIDYDPPSFD